MAININWATRIISIPRSFLTLISGIRYQLSVETLRLALKGLEDSEEGIAFPDTHLRNAPVSLSGITYAQTFEIVNGYTITFEDTGSPYRVECIGANHNISDVQNVNNVSLVVGNSAGMIVVETGVSGLTPGESSLLTGISSIPAQTVAELTAITIPVDVQKINAAEVIGTGTVGDTWRGVGVSP